MIRGVRIASHISDGIESLTVLITHETVPMVSREFVGREFRNGTWLCWLVVGDVAGADGGSIRSANSR